MSPEGLALLVWQEEYRNILAERDAARAEVARLREALIEARTTLVILRGNIATEIRRGRADQWEGVPEKIQEQLDAASVALAAKEPLP